MYCQNFIIFWVNIDNNAAPINLTLTYIIKIYYQDHCLTIKRF